METYLLKSPVSLRIYLTKFRVSNHKLPIERGRYENLERSERKCNVCHVLGDKFHFLFQYSIFNDERRLLLQKYYWSNLSAEKYHVLLSSSNYQKQCKLANFVKIIMSHFR